MPVGLNTGGVIRLDVMNRLEFLRELDAKFALAAERVVRPANFVFSTRAVLQQIDVTDRGGCGARLINVVWLLCNGNLSPEGGDIFVARMGFAIGKHA